MAFIYPCRAFKQFFLTLKEGNIDLLNMGKSSKPEIIQQIMNATGNSEQNRHILEQIIPSKPAQPVDKYKQRETTSRLSQPRTRGGSMSSSKGRGESRTPLKPYQNSRIDSSPIGPAVYR